MGGIKTAQKFEINDEHLAWLQAMSEAYALFDADKALRIVLDYVMEEADQATVFENTRCNRCGGTANQD